MLHHVFFSRDISFLNCHDTYNRHNKIITDSHSFVLDTTECNFSATHRTFHFESVSNAGTSQYTQTSGLAEWKYFIWQLTCHWAVMLPVQGQTCSSGQRKWLVKQHCHVQMYTGPSVIFCDGRAFLKTIRPSHALLLELLKCPTMLERDVH